MRVTLETSRAKMDEYAASIGIEDPGSYPNKESLYVEVKRREAEGDEVADEQQKAPEQKGSAPRSSGADDAGEAEVQRKMDEETEQGFVGRKVDPTPNEAYSMEGGAPDWGDNPTAPSEEDVKNDPTLGDQYEGQKTYTEKK